MLSVDFHSAGNGGAAVIQQTDGSDPLANDASTLNDFPAAPPVKAIKSGWCRYRP
jgi:hypothetical protein